jgi:hypothetical protein
MNPSNTLRQPSRSAGLSIFLITVGTLASIWSAVWYFYMKSRTEPSTDWAYYVCAGSFFSGLALVSIGALVGYIGRTARQADNPVGQVTAAAVAPSNTAATTPAVAPVAGAPVVSATAPATTAAPPRVIVPQEAQKS